MPLLVREGADIDRQPGPGEREAGHHAERPSSQPASFWLSIMAADEEVRTVTPMTPEDGADAVDGRVEPAFLQAPHQPARDSMSWAE